MSRPHGEITSEAAPSAASGAAKGAGGDGPSRFDSSFDALAKNFSIEPKGDEKEVPSAAFTSRREGITRMHAPR